MLSEAELPLMTRKSDLGERAADQQPSSLGRSWTSQTGTGTQTQRSCSLHTGAGPPWPGTWALNQGCSHGLTTDKQSERGMQAQTPRLPHKPLLPARPQFLLLSVGTGPLPSTHRETAGPQEVRAGRGAHTDATHGGGSAGPRGVSHGLGDCPGPPTACPAEPRQERRAK